MNSMHMDLAVALARERQQRLLCEAEAFRRTRMAATEESRPMGTVRSLVRRLMPRLIAAASADPIGSPVAESR